MEREYIVTLNKDVDYDSFWNEIENISTGDNFVPSRRVDIVNNRNGSLRSCHYSITADEAKLLRQDPRIYSVEIPPEQRADIKIGHRASQIGNFTKPINDGSGTLLNYGLRRCISSDNPYSTGTSATGNYDHTLDGTGVDIIIQDSGLQVDHPEFTDVNGSSRVQQINWYTASGGTISGTQSPNFYRDFDGHGTHCAGIAAGKTYGWAKNSNIYSMKIRGLEGFGDSNTGISITDTFDLIKLWHRNKPTNPATGVKRPTIVNMSWGYFSTFSNIDGGNYRGVNWTGNSRRTDYGMVGSTDGVNFYFGIRVSAVDADIEEMIDEGIHICVSAGNDFQKIDLPSGNDYNNYFNGLGFDVFGNIENTTYFYHRGSSPYSLDAFIVGSTDSVVFDATTEQKSTFSNCGAGVDLYAPGSRIVSACSSTNSFSNDEEYYLNSSFRQLNISGTSMAAPQVCGIGALHLQLNPRLTPADLKSRILADAVPSVYSTENSEDYTNPRSISNGNPRFLYQKYNSPNPYEISGGITATRVNVSLG
jgi:subtilisin family serine protease